jgi:hypothetical protein
VIRRCRTPLVALTAVLGLTGSVRASGMASFQLINTTPPGTAAVTQVVATILPAGSVPDGTNPNSSGNPFSVLSGSAGFNAGSLALDPSYTGPPPTLALAPGTTGLSLNSYTPPGTPTPGSGDGGTPTGGGGGTLTPPTAQVPEPISLAFWSAAVGLGLIRARAFRRARKLDA